MLEMLLNVKVSIHRIFRTDLTVLNTQSRYVVFGSTCSFWNNNKKGMFVPDCAYHWHVSSHFMLLRC